MIVEKDGTAVNLEKAGGFEKVNSFDGNGGGRYEIYFHSSEREDLDFKFKYTSEEKRDKDYVMILEEKSFGHPVLVLKEK